MARLVKRGGGSQFGLDYTPSDEQIHHAVRLAHLEETIQKLRNGLETTVGEAGPRLSGGQKQRNQIARAVLKDTPILLLDEATSNLDADAEYQIYQSLQQLMESKKNHCCGPSLIDNYGC